ncbi:MAG: ROK family protein, partial [Candidatus Eremiobacteraeota bacterium]|nr:ROK family protein [Candidatus Eremiobacteraeota bacterium]
MGVDLGGTKIEAIALGADGSTLARRRVFTPAGDYLRTIETIGALITEMEGELRQSASVGVGTPGAISVETGLVKNSNSTVLNGRPLRRDLAERLKREIRIANDANCFSLSEASDGAAQGFATVFGVILGTGVGGGLVVHGRIVEGRNAIAGEWGHNPLPWPQLDDLPGAPCYCGKRGCIETFLSGRGLARGYERRSGRLLDALEITAKAGHGDADSGETVAEYEDRLARGLAHVVNIVDPDVIVLGGGLSNIQRLYKNVPRLMRRYVFSDTFDTPLVPA